MRYDAPGLTRWNAHAYDSGFGYVSAHGAPLVDLLDPQPGSASWTSAAAPGC